MGGQAPVVKSPPKNVVRFQRTLDRLGFLWKEYPNGLVSILEVKTDQSVDFTDWDEAMDHYKAALADRVAQRHRKRFKVHTNTDL